jgi:isopenicillin N synthase-like dioxygenase
MSEDIHHQRVCINIGHQEFEKILFEDLCDNKNNSANALSSNITNHGFAIVSLGSTEKTTLLNAYNSAKIFFTTASKDEKDNLRVLFDEVGSNKGLAGFNSPTAAKELFRVRRGIGMKWPQTPNMQNTTLASFDLLERVLNTCLYKLLWDIDIDAEKLLSDICDTRESLNSRQTLSTSPFDFFHYFNTEQAQGAINCHEHVDPGLMTIVPCAFTPGLEILHPDSKQWLKVEQHCSPLEDVVVFGDQVLQDISQGVYPAAIHRVSKNTASRLSLVYELRPRAGFDVSKLLV